MLVMRSGDIGGHQVTVGIVGAVGNALGGHDAREHDAHFESTVLVEDPFEAVLVIAGLAPIGEHQFARAAGVVGVLPFDAAIALE